ncbi:hypothetical protein SDC9_207533 [bioreactor metagenome]|uniref:Uncharacterized protein n=1 Tax=bioreactor metagenome TaxID=1076179 RepID=A0A645J863_9ZZZZ
MNIPDTVFCNLPETPFLYHLRNITASDSLGLGRGDSESFAVEIQIKGTACAHPPACSVKGELLQ